MPAQDDQRLAEILREDKVINQDQYDKVKMENVNTGKTIESLLVKHNFVSPSNLAQAKAKIYNIPFINLSTSGVNPQAMHLVPEVVAKRFTVFPFALDSKENKLSVAMADPLYLTAIEFLEKKTGQRI